MVALIPFEWRQEPLAAGEARMKEKEADTEHENDSQGRAAGNRWEAELETSSFVWKVDAIKAYLCDRKGPLA